MEPYLNALLFAALPAAGNFAGGLLAEVFNVSQRSLSFALHAAAGVLLAALIGVPLYLNNFSALPIVSGLLAQGMQPGAAIAFLIAGPVTTIPAMTAVWGIARREVFALYLSVALMGSILAGILTNLVL